MQKSPKLKADEKQAAKEDKKQIFLLENYHMLNKTKGVLKFSIMTVKERNAGKRERRVQENETNT